MIEYNIEEQRTSAIQLLQNKQVTLVNRVKDGYYSKQRLYADDDEERLIEVFENCCERLRLGLVTPGRILPLSLNSLFQAAKHFVYLERLIDRLKQGEDPRILLLEIMSSND